MAVKDFKLGAVLSVTTGYVVGENKIDDVKEVIQFMASAPELSPLLLVMLKQGCTDALLKQFPVLGCEKMKLAIADLASSREEVGADQAKIDRVCDDWLDRLTSGVYGFNIDKVLPIQSLDHDS